MIRLFRVFVPAGTLILLISEAILVAAIFLLTAAVAAYPTDLDLYLLYENGIARILVVVFIMLLALHFEDLYSELFVSSRINLLLKLVMVAGITLVLEGVISSAWPDLRVPTAWFAVACAAALTCIFVWRLIFSAFVLRAVGRKRVLLVGATPLLAEIGRHMHAHPEKGSQVVGYVTGENPPGTLLPGGEVLGGIAELGRIVESTRPHRIVVGVPEGRDGLPVAELLELRYSGHTVEEASTAYEKAAGRVCLKALRPGQLIASGEYAPRPADVLYQTAANLLVALAGLLVAFPFMLAAAVAVRLSSPGPVLNRHIRLGRNGRRFTLYKFRSMRGPEGEAGVWAPRNDPRVTRVGRILRFTRVDELPQLFNVLRGDMAIIGPRAEQPEFAERLADLIPCYPQRLVVRPGITGWAQINLESGQVQDAIARLEYDLYYIKNMSASLDAFVLLHTVKAVVQARGAD